MYRLLIKNGGDMPRTIEISDEVFQVIDDDAKRHESDSDVIARWAKNLGLLTDSVIITNDPISKPVRYTRRSPRRIDYFHLFGQHYAVDKWWKLFAKVAEVLAIRHQDLKHLLLQSTHVSLDETSFRNSKGIPHTNFHFEANQSAASILAESEALLSIFGYDPKKELAVQEHVARASGNQQNYRQDPFVTKKRTNMLLAYPNEAKSNESIDWLRAIIEFLQSDGGEASIQSVYEGIYQRFEVECDNPELSIPYASSPSSPAWQTRIRTARDQAVKIGLIYPPNISGRGIWRLTAKGHNWA